MGPPRKYLKVQDATTLSGLEGLELDPQFTFETLVVGASNRLAAAAARRVAETPGRVYNPLFVFSASGLGKTHLLTAIGHYSQRLNPGLEVLYGTLEHFLQGVMAAIEAGERDAFLRRLRGTGLLLLDDVQFLAGQRGVQEELIRGWDALMSRGGQVVLASDRPPSEIDGLGQRLLSRFSSGLVLDIGTPDYETRVAIVRQKTAERGRTLQDGVAEALAKYAFFSVRELQGALNRLLAVQDLEGRLVRPDEVGGIIGKIARRKQTGEFGGFVEAVAGSLDAIVPADAPESRLAEAILEWGGAGYRTRRLEAAAQEVGNSLAAEEILAAYEADIKQLQDIENAIAELDPEAPELAKNDILYDPDRLPEAGKLLEEVRRRMSPLPQPPSEHDFDSIDLDPDLLAVRAAQAAAARPAQDYNPLFIYGPPGSGKSALLAALGNRLIAGGEVFPVAFLKGSDFAAELVSALQTGAVSGWRARYRGARALLIDDVDALAETERAQEELFHLFDGLIRSGAQLAFTAAQPPDELDGLELRLRTRLASGLIVDLPARRPEEPWAEAPESPLDPEVLSEGIRDSWFVSREKIVWDPDPRDLLVEEMD